MSVSDLLNQLDDEEVQQISRQIGADPAQTRSAIENAAPLLLAGFAKTAEQQDGQASIQSALDSQAGVADNVRTFLAAPGIADGGGILDRILGNNKPAIQDGVQQTTGLNGDQVKRLLAILAPIVIGMLAKRRQQSSPQSPLDQQIREEANQAQQQAQQRSPQIGGILGKILGYVEESRKQT